MAHFTDTLTCVVLVFACVPESLQRRTWDSRFGAPQKHRHLVGVCIQRCLVSPRLACHLCFVVQDVEGTGLKLHAVPSTGVLSAQAIMLRRKECFADAFEASLRYIAV